VRTAHSRGYRLHVKRDPLEVPATSLPRQLTRLVGQRPYAIHLPVAQGNPCQHAQSADLGGNVTCLAR
jgi:hypothetical protein